MVALLRRLFVAVTVLASALRGQTVAVEVEPVEPSQASSAFDQWVALLNPRRVA